MGFLHWIITAKIKESYYLAEMTLCRLRSANVDKFSTTVLISADLLKLVVFCLSTSHSIYSEG